ncbi:MAG: hypothetical protein EA396_11530 [Anaerolineaceae bacterium]|nr:MAG: hypothetical protein EA396_11530 [Anaerolineaceae bacterium]
MSQISAAENRIIQSDSNGWRLLSYNEHGREAEMLRATGGQPLRFSAEFALSRRLPAAGKLPLKYVRMVVCGWSHKDAAWMLGLLLVDELAAIRGSRWCEIATWPDPDPDVFAELAKQSGEELAAVIGVRFNFVPPRQPDASAPAPDAPLPTLPIDMDEWLVEQAAGDNIILSRTRRWRNRRYLRLLWYGLLTAIYVALSVATIQSDLALPNSGIMLPSPELLPYLGLVAALITLGIALNTALDIAYRPNRLLIDAVGGRVVWLYGNRERRQIDADAIESVYVTHILRRRRGQVVIDHSEINLHLTDGAFRRIVYHEPSGNPPMPGHADADHIEDYVIALRPTAQMSAAQTTALYIARALGDTICYYDQREK